MNNNISIVASGEPYFPYESVNRCKGHKYRQNSRRSNCQMAFDCTKQFELFGHVTAPIFSPLVTSVPCSSAVGAAPRRVKRSPGTGGRRRHRTDPKVRILFSLFPDLRVRAGVVCWRTKFEDSVTKGENEYHWMHACYKIFKNRTKGGKKSQIFVT